jgi:drug/metabolite transporter (DMT)-like permease
MLFGAADLAGGIAARRDHAIRVTAFSALGALAVLVLLLPFVHGTPSRVDLLWGVAGGLCGAAGATLIYYSLALGPVSVASPTFCVIGLTTPVIFGLLIGERPSWLALTGVALAAISLPPLAWSGPGESAASRAHLRRTFGVAVLAGCVIGGFLICVERIGPGAGIVPLIVARGTAIVAFGIALLAMRGPLVPVRSARPVSLLAGALDSAANVAYWLAVQSAPIALVAALVSVAPATTVVLARFVLHERWSGAQRLGLALAIAAGACISLG